ncbi:MAG: MerR family transcriptional regulator [Fusobacteria bacterium]|nr:MAG: MerR family transcriptional regulator [Fusobacteriota bacterium]KAF0229836.1 MAG: MerR family transcriptional [Fusobacteriota bacterium]
MIKEYFSIGELSDLFNINTQTLRYYDSIGLFSPTKRDDETGYRYYQFNQLYELASIRYLRKLDYSIHNIDAYMKSRKVDFVLDNFKDQSRMLHEKWDELIKIDSIIHRKISFIEDEVPKIKFDEYDIRFYEARRYSPIGSEEQLYRSEMFYFYPTIAFYEDTIKSFGALLVEEAEGALVNNKNLISIIPKGKFLCGYHKGNYSNITETMNKIYNDNKKLKLDKVTMNFNIIDQFVESDVENYVTCIQIKIIED